MSNTEKTIVISLGGSLIIPDNINTEFLHNFKTAILKAIKNGKKIIIITGGGKTARVYQDALREIGATQDDLDWIGIHTTHLNARFVQIVFKDVVEVEIIPNPGTKPRLDIPIAIGAGWKPGFSSDMAAVMVAESAQASTVINLSNISHVYDSDPRENPDAKKFDTLSWEQYRSFIPEEWSPGLSTPFDPIASKKAEELGLTVAIMNGDIDNLEQYLETGKATGTIIS